ncbi:MAG: hypothetical protein CM15mV51_1440 [uncultured marine virus]|nr:MAG: hypothetical protein CM15mV51_1440 [uncultured marine virus]
MLSRIKRILTYYDSEPTEIMQGIIWFLLFPVVYTIEHGFSLVLVIISICIGFSSLWSPCYDQYKLEKYFFSVFCFSLIVVQLIL